MPYRFAVERQDYGDFASGKVFYNLPGHPAFPVRLASEVFLRYMEIRQRSGESGPARLYDPCCGGAYHLAVLAYFHWESITEIIASDIDPDALAVAARNLSLLTLEGLDRRVVEIAELEARYGKESHRQALASATALKQRLEANLSSHAIPTRLFQADALEREAIAAAFGEGKADLVIADIPYGMKSSWQVSGEGGEGAPVNRMLEALWPVLSGQAVVAVASAKGDRVSHPDFAQVGRLKLGFRAVTLLKPRPS